ncbi:MAG: efflux transporter outer membrane subunit [Paucibacter sp.]|nr:efflux transporter outer membrane subunit [Roseateles sp.]
MDAERAPVACRAVFAVLALLAGCAAGPDFAPPAAPTASTYVPEQVQLGAAAGLQWSNARPIPADWWRAFGSHELDTLVAAAWRDNPTRAAAEQSLRRSLDNLRAGDAVFFPQAALGLGASRAHSAPIAQGSPLSGSIFSVVTLGASVSYALDIFGQQRRMVEGLQAQVDEQQDLARATALSLAANVVDTAIARAAYEAQVDATERQCELVREQLELTRAQVQAGTAGAAAELALLATLHKLNADLSTLQQRRDASAHLLAILLGQDPADAKLPTLGLQALERPAELPLSLPSELVRQRPDIRAAEARLHEASAAVGVATAALFPSVELSATAGRAGNGIANLAHRGERYWSSGAALDLPVAAAPWWGRAAAIDAYGEAQAQYRATVLDAFGQVADTLTALAHDEAGLQESRASLDAAEEGEALVAANVLAGLLGQADLLAAQAQTLQARVAWLQALALRLQDTVALYAALGGGWWNATEAPK